jgi:hypothetical protein
MQQNVIEANRQRDLYLTDETHVYFAPQGWCDAWSVAKGHTGGLDYVDDEAGPQPEIYCYAPACVTPNSEVETLFVRVASLQRMREITEYEARTIHPQLFECLKEIDETTL